MEWIDFTFNIAGYSFIDSKTNQIINKGILFDRCKNDESLLRSVVDGTSSRYRRVDSDGWKDQECFFQWRYNPVTNKPFKQKYDAKMKSLFDESIEEEEGYIGESSQG